MLAQLVCLYTPFVSVMVRYTQLIVGVVGRAWKIVCSLLMLFSHTVIVLLLTMIIDFGAMFRPCLASLSTLTYAPISFVFAVEF